MTFEVYEVEGHGRLRIVGEVTNAISGDEAILTALLRSRRYPLTGKYVAFEVAEARELEIR